MSHGIEAFGYEYLTDGQSSPELTINKNLLANYVLHKGIADRDLTTPPGSPADGAAYIPAATATGAWAGHEDDIAYWFDETGVWKFLVPEVGISIYVDDEALPIRYYGGSTGWDVIAGNGTVTSVDTAGTVAGLTLTGGPITGSGTVTLGGTLSVDLTTMVTGSLPVANGGTGRATGTTAYALIATGTTATGAQQTLANGATTEVLVGGGASALPVWTTVTGTGAPVLATSPTLITPILGTPTSGTLTNCGGLVATTECIAGYIAEVSDKTYKLVVKMPHGATITEATTISESGTCTATFKINTTALGGTANSVSSSETSQAHASANVASAGDDIQLTVSSNSTCLGLSFSLKYTRTIS